MLTFEALIIKTIFMEMNYLAILVAASSSFLVGFIWYNPKVFGTLWMTEIGMTEEKAREANMVKVFGLSFVFAIMLAFMMPTIVIHQIGATQLAGGNANDPALIAFLEVHGNMFRSLQHGALHGFLAALFFVLPILGINGLYEQKSFKYIMITSGYWMVTLTIMGAIICGWK